MKAVKVEAECDRNPVHGSDEKPSVLETGTAKTNETESFHGSVSESRKLPFKVGGPRPDG